MSYRVQLQNFEGPLDLLLFLIKKEEVDIYDIPIAQITKQYMEYLSLIEMLDLDNAGEFVLMAATLIRIKAKMLLPRPEPEDGEDIEDPRQELVHQLLEYQRYKEAASGFREFEHSQSDYFKAENFAFRDDNNEEEEELVGGVTLFDLMSVFVEVIKKMPVKTEHTVEHVPVTIEEQSAFVLRYLQNKKQVLFSELLAQVKERIILIVTFIAILELVKGSQVRLNQAQPFAEIWIQRG